jgi:hypothetical protein
MKGNFKKLKGVLPGKLSKYNKALIIDIQRLFPLPITSA